MNKTKVIIDYKENNNLLVFRFQASDDKMFSIKAKATKVASEALDFDYIEGSIHGETYFFSTSTLQKGMEQQGFNESQVQDFLSKIRIVPSKRGVHSALSLARMDRLSFIVNKTVRGEKLTLEEMLEETKLVGWCVRNNILTQETLLNDLHWIKGIFQIASYALSMGSHTSAYIEAITPVLHLVERLFSTIEYLDRNLPVDLTPKDIRFLVALDAEFDRRTPVAFAHLKNTCAQLVDHLLGYRSLPPGMNIEKASMKRNPAICKEILSLLHMIEPNPSKWVDCVNVADAPYSLVKEIQELANRIEREFTPGEIDRFVPTPDGEIHKVRASMPAELRESILLTGVLLEYTPSYLEPINKTICASIAEIERLEVFEELAEKRRSYSGVMNALTEVHSSSSYGQSLASGSLNEVFLLNTRENGAIWKQTYKSPRTEYDEMVVEKLWTLRRGKHIVPVFKIQSTVKQLGLPRASWGQRETLKTLIERNGAEAASRVNNLSPYHKNMKVRLDYQARQYQQHQSYCYSALVNRERKQTTFTEFHEGVNKGTIQGIDYVIDPKTNSDVELDKLRKTDWQLNAALNWNPAMVRDEEIEANSYKIVIGANGKKREEIVDWKLSYPYVFVLTPSQELRTCWFTPVKGGMCKEFIYGLQTLNQLGKKPRMKQHVLAHLDDESHYTAALMTECQLKDGHVGNIGFSPVSTDNYRHYSQYKYAVKLPGETEASVKSFAQFQEAYLNGDIRSTDPFLMLSGDSTHLTKELKAKALSYRAYWSEELRTVLKGKWRLVQFDGGHALGESNAFTQMDHGKGIFLMAPIQSGLLSTSFAKLPYPEHLRGRLVYSEQGMRKTLDWMRKADAPIRRSLTYTQNRELDIAVHDALNHSSFMLVEYHTFDFSVYTYQEHAKKLHAALMDNEPLWDLLCQFGLADESKKAKILWQLVPRLTINQQCAYVKRVYDRSQYLVQLELLADESIPVDIRLDECLAQGFIPLSTWQKELFKDELRHAKSLDDKKNVLNAIKSLIDLTYENMLKVSFPFVADVLDVLAYADRENLTGKKWNIADYLGNYEVPLDQLLNDVKTYLANQGATDHQLYATIIILQIEMERNHRGAF